MPDVGGLGGKLSASDGLDSFVDAIRVKVVKICIEPFHSSNFDPRVSESLKRLDNTQLAQRKWLTI